MKICWYIQTWFKNDVVIKKKKNHEYVANRGEYDWCLSQIRHFVNILIQTEALLSLLTYVTTSSETRQIW